MKLLKTYQKSYSDSYLRSMHKDNLIDIIRIYENTINNLCDEVELYQRRLTAYISYGSMQLEEEKREDLKK